MVKDYYKFCVIKFLRLVDVYDSYWESWKLLLKVLLSFWKEFVVVDVGDDFKDEIICLFFLLLIMVSFFYGSLDVFLFVFFSNGLGLLCGIYFFI